jgi:hypothetical protein
MAIWYLYRYYDFCLVLKSGVEVPVFNENSTCIFLLKLLVTLQKLFASHFIIVVAVRANFVSVEEQPEQDGQKLRVTLWHLIAPLIKKYHLFYVKEKKQLDFAH